MWSFMLAKVTQPPSSIKLSCFQESTSLSIVTWCAASGAARKRLAQILAASVATACSVEAWACSVAVAPVSQPPAVKPTIMVRAETPTLDQNQTVLEIGRETGRERVCQYGEHPVGAGSVQKKTTSIKHTKENTA